MAAPSVNKSEDEDKKIFICCLCSFKVNYHYYGKKPPFVKPLLLLEDAYVLRDPFSTEKGFINIGAHCSLCSQPVCMSQECSLFYTKRFCMNCVKAHFDEFPLEIKQELSKRSRPTT